MMMASTPLKIAICCLLILALFTSYAQSDTFDTLALKKFDEWMTNYGKNYKNLEEKAKRFQIFKENLLFIETFNQKKNSIYTLRSNEFFDLTNEEFLNTYTGSYKVSAYNVTSVFEPNYEEIPESMDWVQRGAVTEVQNQKKCGACWSFSSIGAVEGITKIKKGILRKLSKQQLVDCNVRTNGCGGGDLIAAFEYIMNNGITSEEYYPYTATNGICNSYAASNVVAQISGYHQLPQSENELLSTVAMQPVSIRIDAHARTFHYYGGGAVYTGPCGNDLNHDVLVVGYGTDPSGTKYWLLKNSWGTSWGESGYMKIQRDSGYPEGLCGLVLGASYPIA